MKVSTEAIAGVLYRVPDVMQVTGDSRSFIYEAMGDLAGLAAGNLNFRPDCFQPALLRRFV